MKKLSYTLFFVGIIFMMPCFRADASMVINEIMYDLKEIADTDHEWVELYNDSGTAVDITGWKFNDGAASNHGLNVPPDHGGQGTMQIPANGYVVLADDASAFLSVYPGFSGTLIDTIIDLKNDTDTIKIIDSANATIDTLTYTSDQGGAGDGNSLGKLNGAWAGTTPTPATENILGGTSSGGSDTGGTTTGSEANGGGGLLAEETSTETKSTTVEPEQPKMTLDIGMQGGPYFINTPIHFLPKIFGYGKEPLTKGKLIISFGDGMTRTDTDVVPFDYSFDAVGEYVIYAEYNQNPYMEQPVPDTTKRASIKVLDPGIAIASISSDGTVTITNTSSYEINLGGWSLMSGLHSFVFPKNTILLQGHKMNITAKVSGFRAISPLKNVVLKNPAGIIFSEFPKKKIETTKIVTGAAAPVAAPVSVKLNSEIKASDILPASAAQSDASRSSILEYIFFVLGALAFAGIAWYIRMQKRKGEGMTPADQIAENITIIE